MIQIHIGSLLIGMLLGWLACGLMVLMLRPDIDKDENE